MTELVELPLQSNNFDLNSLDAYWSDLLSTGHILNICQYLTILAKYYCLYD